MASLELYNYFRSSTSYRVRIALHFKNLSFEYHPVHLLNKGGEQHADNYKRWNPMAEVPTLIHEGKSIAQSVAIIEYLEEVFPKPALLPSSPLLRAQVRQFCENINSFLHPLSNLKVLQYLEKSHQYDQTKKDQWVNHWAQKGLTALENTLKQTAGTFCFGDQVTAADVFLVPQIFSAERFHVPLENFPICKKINAHCLTLEPFKKAHPYRQVDTPVEVRI